MKIRLLLFFACGFMLMQACTKKEIIPAPVITIPNTPPDSLQSANNFTISNILQSNMVIQRDKPFKIWGTATANYKVTVTVTWSITTFTTTADANGNWILSIPPQAATSAPQTITASVNGKPAITFSNILIGDVWLCSGQSNMEMPLTQKDNPATVYGGFYGVENYQSEIAKADHPNLRVATVSFQAQNQPKNNLNGPVQWIACSSQTAGNFSALGYYFGEKIDSALNIPVGIIISCVPNTGIETWTSLATMQASPLLTSFYSTRSLAAQFYNGMIYPLRNLSIKGFVWSQGENNDADTPAMNYTIMSNAMIGNWRTIFAQGNLPFYYVQVVPIYNGSPGTTDVFPKFWVAQGNIRTTTPNTGMAVTTDIGSLFVIHYTDKEPVGDRLARLAMHYTYGLPVAAVGPQYQSFTQSGTTVTVTFTNADGLKSDGPLSQNFYVSGSDEVFYQAKAAISGNTIVLTVPAKVTTVTAVRFSFTNTSYSNVYNGDDLPMEAFRSDNYPD
jgi:sialate O-acetylesterase